MKAIKNSSKNSIASKNYLQYALILNFIIKYIHLLSELCKYYCIYSEYINHQYFT